MLSACKTLCAHKMKGNVDHRFMCSNQAWQVLSIILSSVGENLCMKIFNSNILSSNLNAKLLGYSMSTQSMKKTCVWLPFMKMEGAAGYKNIYTNAEYNHTELQTALGMSSLALTLEESSQSAIRLAWYHEKGSEPSVKETNSDYTCQTYCDSGSLVAAKPVTIRGLCEQSTIDTDYYPIKNGWSGRGEGGYMILNGGSDDKELAALINLESKTYAYVNDSESNR